jgi:hypothetical protein
MADYEVSTEGKLAANAEVQSKQGLLYIMPSSLSSSTNSTFIRQQAQRNSYTPGQTMVFDMNTGSRYIDPCNSALHFDFNVVGTGGTADVFRTFSNNAGAVALIEEIRIHSKSGTELERCQEVNQYVFSRSMLKQDSDYFKKYSSLWGGYDPLILGTERDAMAEPTNTGSARFPANARLWGETMADKHYVIPMAVISGLFDPTVTGMKLAPGGLSGARIEIVLEETARAIGPGINVVPDVESAPITSYTVTNPFIECLSHELTDNTQRVLNQESVANGLEYTFNRLYTTVETSSQTNINIQIKKAVSQGLKAFCIPILATDATGADSESFSSSRTYLNYNYRVGSRFHPQQKVDTPEEGYYITQNIYNKHKTAGWYSNNMTVDNYKDLQPIMGASLETDAALNLAGVPINNSNTLELAATVVNAGGDAVNYYVFFEYVAVMRSYLTNSLLKI